MTKIKNVLKECKQNDEIISSIIKVLEDSKIEYNQINDYEIIIENCDKEDIEGILKESGFQDITLLVLLQILQNKNDVYIRLKTK